MQDAALSDAAVRATFGETGPARGERRLATGGAATGRSETMHERTDRPGFQDDVRDRAETPGRRGPGARRRAGVAGPARPAAGSGGRVRPLRAEPAAFAADRRGATAIEFALLAALVGLACVAALGNLSASVTDVLQDLAVALDRAMN